MLYKGYYIPPVVSDYIQEIKLNMKIFEETLSNPQMRILSLILLGIAVCNGVCWAKIERFSLRGLSKASCSYFIHHCPLAWAVLLQAAVLKIIKDYEIKKVTLVVDDTNLPRCKLVRALFGVFKTRDKETGGYINAQNLVVLSVVALGVTFPIAFSFYRPDPKVTLYKRELKKAKQKKLPKEQYPKKVERRKNYPTQQEIFLKLLAKVQEFFQKVEKKCGIAVKVSHIVGDNGYVSGKTVRIIEKTFPNSIFVGRMKNSQCVFDKKLKSMKNVEKAFEKWSTQKIFIELRGELIEIEYASARLFVKSFSRKVHVIALRFSDTKEFRYIFGNNLSFRAEDIIKIFSRRWLIEVVFQDEKRYIGRGQKACQQGADGAAKVVFLSLLTDLLLLSHPQQIAQFRAHQPLYTAGTICSLLQIESLKNSIENAILEDENPLEALKQLFKRIEGAMDFRFSKKHLSLPSFPDIEPSPALQKRFGFFESAC